MGVDMASETTAQESIEGGHPFRPRKLLQMLGNLVLMQKEFAAASSFFLGIE
jgi:hypothetical protein